VGLNVEPGVGQNVYLCEEVNVELRVVWVVLGGRRGCEVYSLPQSS